MKTLIVEDNPKKRASLVEYYSSEFPSDDLEVTSALISGLRVARDTKPEFIILDMTLPNYSPDENKGSRIELMPFAGREFVMRVNRMSIKTKVIIVSMFETFGVAPRLITLNSLDAELRDRYPNVFVEAVHYSQAQADWKTAIKNARLSLDR
ncbi:conserved response regulator receiver protein of 17.3 kDa (plasmid) [Sinorhizobium fredii NGR234]|uniref:Uncharacterized protein y4jR n=1 Tax=Sinorhizobium fredii (strain NBRC 101917 / NGR234) TaxID=394 RepID=Y4JR_SINFN|nr:response regulator transcription factor [Sinorhizobium fredii]P55518.1 RecName: Full=Uncharacterized protein y4jR [Sinorhizobium fredii NGR234]AAB91730.1 conserved response regulator receiver protein of 17.3 kDa [Sinorhizobium fredii NGR234]